MPDHVRAEASRDLHLALSLGVPEESSSFLLFCFMCPRDACCPQSHREWGHVSAVAPGTPVSTLMFEQRPRILGLQKLLPSRCRIRAVCPGVLPGFRTGGRGSPCSPYLEPRFVTDQSCLWPLISLGPSLKGLYPRGSHTVLWGLTLTCPQPCHRGLPQLQPGPLLPLCR